MHFNILTVKLWPDICGILRWSAYFDLSFNGALLLEDSAYVRPAGIGKFGIGEVFFTRSRVLQAFN